MAAPTGSCESVTINKRCSKYCQVEATVPTGLEYLAQEEIVEKLGCEVEEFRGHVTMQIPVHDTPKILELQSIDNIGVLIHQKDIDFVGDKEEDLSILRDLVPEMNWSLGLEVWSKFYDFEHPVSSIPQTKKLELNGNTENSQLTHCTVDPAKADDMPSDVLEKNIQPSEHVDVNLADSTQNDQVPKEQCGNNDTLISEIADIPPKRKYFNPLLPKFRATCHRSGNNHSFQSPQAAIQFGGAVQDYFGWNVDMKDHDIEIVLTVQENVARTTIALTKTSLHRRDITDFGHTTLRATIAYNMLRMCNIKPDEIVCDPLCGSGSIPIQGAINWPQSVHICGDINEISTTRCWNNINGVNKERLNSNRKEIGVDVVRWDTTNLPLKENLVDVFVTDLPFGIRSGSKFDNRKLYPNALKEMARVCKLGTGRACLLTHDKRTIQRAMQAASSLWKRGKTVWINIGGIAAGVFMLYRTNESHLLSTKTKKK